LTHSELLDGFLARYGAARAKLEPAIKAFTPADLRAWCEGLGIETFVGSSGRVFPRQMKASPLLRAWLARLGALGVTLVPRSRWTGWQDNALVFDTPDGRRIERPDAAIFALGGTSWPRLGSDGAWQAAFAERGARIEPFRPSNSGFLVQWSDVFRERFAGQPVKPAGFLFAPDFNSHSLRGEALITREGIEGGAIYALSAPLREFIARTGRAFLALDLAPNVTVEDLATRLGGDAKTSTANRLRKAGLSPVAAGLVREGVGGPALPAEPMDLARRIKGCTLRLTSTTSIDRAISTAGGICWDSLNADYSLKSDPRTFVAGEMLDWEAPTGGYLLQACIATGIAAARGVLMRG
ncbi:MAG: TIGR03862 family flavoprotein, partial [Hyphomonadaceae bacterium]